MKNLVKDFVEIMPLMNRKFFRHLRKHDFKKNTGVLMNIHDHNGKSMSYYCKAMVISKPNFSKIVDELIREGFVERKQSETDRRVYNIFVTPKGETEVEMRKKIIFDLVEDKLSKFNEDEKDALHEHILGIHEILNKLKE